MMGIPYDESFTVAELIGTKLFLNEFVAYEKLSALKNNRLNGILKDGVAKNWISVSIYVTSHQIMYNKYVVNKHNSQMHNLKSMLPKLLAGSIRSHLHLCTVWLC